MDAPKGITSDVIEKMKVALNPQVVEQKEEPEQKPEEVTQEGTTDEVVEAEPQAEVRTYKVKVDGEEIEVPEDELLKGYSRTSDYTKKTQKLSEERKALESEAQAVKAEREEYTKGLEILKSQLTQVNEPDWDRLAQEDPIEFVKQKELARDRKEKVAAIEQEQRRVAELHAQEQQRAFQKFVQDEQARLADAIPEWKDAKIAKAEKEKIASFASSLGYSEADIAQIYDHRAVVALRKAALYDEMMSKARTQVEKAKDAPKTATPGNLKTVPANKAFLEAKSNLARSGKLSDFAKAFSALNKQGR